MYSQKGGDGASLLKEPLIHSCCLGIISAINDTYLYSEDLYSLKRDDSKLFLKGGNAVTMLLNEKAPYPFTSDFDVAVLIDPAKYTPDYFITVLKSLIFATSAAVQIATYEYWDNIKQLYKKNGLNEESIEDLEKKFGKIVYKTKNNKHKRAHYSLEDASRLPLFVKSKMKSGVEFMLEKHFDFSYSTPLYTPVDLLKNEIHVDYFKVNFGSPFEIEVIPDLTYGYQSTGITLIKIKTRTSPSIELIDIAIPRKEYPLYETEWKLASEHLIEKDGIPITNKEFALFDQRLAAESNTREEKRKKRTERANALRGKINHNTLQKVYNILPSNVKPVINGNLNTTRKNAVSEPTTVGGVCPCMFKGGYKPTKRNLFYLRKWKKGQSIGFTMRSSLKAKGLIPRSNGTYKVSNKYKK
jgi:hypothetical protein